MYYILPIRMASGKYITNTFGGHLRSRGRGQDLWCNATDYSYTNTRMISQVI